VAQITRRGWSDLLTEFKRAARGVRYSGWSSRAEYLLYEAYLDICTVFHHRELEAKERVSLSTGGYTAAYPTDANVLFLVAEIDADNLPTLFLEGVHVSSWSGIFQPENSGRPTQYGTFERTVYLDRKVEVPRAYYLYYQRRPTAPDFGSSTVPEIGPQWDHHLIEAALVKAGIRTSDPALAALNAQMFKDYIAQQPQPLIRESTAPVASNEPTQDRLQSGRST